MLVEPQRETGAAYWKRPARIIRSNRSGATVGAFGETAFVGDRLHALTPDFKQGGRSIWSYGVDLERRRALAVVLAPFGDGELQRLTEGQIARTPCLEQSQRTNSPGPVISRELLMLGRGASAMPARLYRGPTTSKKLVVWMHGGPNSSVAYEYGLDQVAELVALGYDVLVPEYRGSRGNDPRMAAELSRFGRTSIHSDLAALESWVRASDYGSATLYGISFGGLFSWLAADSDAFDRHVLVAPLLKWRGEALFAQRQGEPDWTGRRRFLQTSIDNVFGPTFSNGQLSLVPELAPALHRCRYNVPFLAVFGERDDRSQVADLGPCRQSGLGSIEVLSGAPHEATGGRALDRVRQYLTE